jgi:murein DD-endopeptidase MepM/ murein hydrolase activator NlpD
MVAVLLSVMLAATPTCPVEDDPSFSDDYGIWAKGRRHRGVDMFAERGTPVVAPSAGLVDIGVGRKGGKVVRLYAFDGDYFYLAHLDDWAPGAMDGWLVPEGYPLGYVGNTGNARCCDPHLHFGWKHNGRYKNPYPWLTEACAPVLPPARLEDLVLD